LAGIYIHIPFCKQACNYCDFHFSTNLSNKPAVGAAIGKEIQLRGDYLGQKQVESIYFGGGTPSLLSLVELEAIFGALRANFSWIKDAEVTLEANPDDFTEQKLRGWLQAGINRLSIGLQSFNEDELQWMNRAHTASESVESVFRAQAAGFANITIDLIYGSKFQTLQSWEKTLSKAIKLGVQHISAYNLTIEERTALGVHLKKGQEPAIDDELSKAQFLLMVKMLETAGFEHYEISNFARQGFIAKHNSNYWLQQPYIGFGPSAHSYNGTSRQWNLKNNALYVKAVHEGAPYFEKEELTVRDRYNEYVLTRLRTKWGCDILEIEKIFGEEFKEGFVQKVKEQKEFLVEKNGVYTLTLEGKLRADGIAAEFFVL
jgi:oxygen-independent coproporphyrinogen-3 oxidase